MKRKQTEKSGTSNKQQETSTPKRRLVTSTSKRRLVTSTSSRQRPQATSPPNKRSATKKVQIPAKPSPPPTRIQDDYYWFKYLRAELGDKQFVEAKEEDLGFSPKEMKDATRTSDLKRNYFVKEVQSGALYIVKMCSNLEKSRTEWEINERLKILEIPHVLPAVAWFQGKQTAAAKSKICGYLVIPFVLSTSFDTLSKLPRDSPWKLTDIELLNGLKQLMELLVLTDPKGAGDLQLVHKDLKKDQILYDRTNGQWYLIDFGLAEATWKETIRGVEAAVTMSGSSSVRSSSDETALVVSMFFTAMESPVSFERLKALQGKDRSYIYQRVLEYLAEQE